MKQKEYVLNRVISLTKDKYPDSEIYLYGSRARGNFNKYSDWDFLVLMNRDKLSFETEITIMDDFYELELETGEVLSPLIYTKNDWNINHLNTPLFENVNKEGIKIK